MTDPFTQMTTELVPTTGGAVKLHYNAADERVLKVQRNQATLYLHGLSDYPLVEKTDNVSSFQETRYIYGIGGLVATVVNEQTQFVFKDHLGSTRVVVSSDGTSGIGYSYDALGNMIAQSAFGAPTFAIAYQFTGQEYDDQTGLHNFRARLYDSDLFRFYATDPAGQFHSPYAFAGNAPLMFVDKDGRLAWFVPIIIGAVMGGAIGAMQAQANNIPWYQGLLKGAIVGGVGGALGQFGGGGLLENVLWGVGQGAATGALSAGLYGQDIGSGLLKGALSGGAFALASSGVEALTNSIDGYGFKLNDDVLNDYFGEMDFNPYAHEGAIKFVQKRYGFDDVNITPDLGINDYGVTSPDGNIKIGKAGFQTIEDLKVTVAHEWAHSKFDRILDANGNFMAWKPDEQFESGPFNIAGIKPRATIDAPSGYPAEVIYSGKMHISLNYLSRITPANGLLYYNTLSWHNMGVEKWFYALPRRFPKIQ